MKLNNTIIAYGVGLLLLTGLIFQSYRLSVNNNVLGNTNTQIILLKDKLSRKTDTISLLEAQRDSVEIRNLLLAKTIIRLDKENKKLDRQLDSAISAIDSIPADENYSYLQDSAYTYDGDKIYPFNGKQVTEIRKDYVANNMLRKINGNLEVTIYTLKKQVDTQDTIITNQYVQIDVYKDMIVTLKEINVINDEAIKKLNKEVVKQKRLKYILEGIGVAEAFYILISII
jgi:hypothetical protein